MKTRNIFKFHKIKNGNEVSKTLAGKKISGRNFVVEQIVSNGAKSPEGFWYDQKYEEFVIVLKGRAKIGFYKKKSIALKAGDYLLIPKHVRHRIEYTSSKPKCVWLALHLGKRAKDKK
ncbi:MAG: cupin domain-containing protein [Endomicrobia bacterium]|nr:cupin domain-containing protein [Endomicrobiia bacterium]